MGLPALVSSESPASFGPYELIEQLGQGGMAVIYRARVRQRTGGFSRDVVLKAMLPELVKSAPLVEMFESEARLTAQLRHPNIVQVEDFGVVGQIPYLIMEVLDGKNLSQLRNALNRQKRRTPIGAAVSIVRDLCYALGYAHYFVGPDGKRMQIIHRDVSPSNVMVLRDGSIRLLDFGVAKLSSHAGQAVTGSLKGKFAYMSPEQVNQEPIDRRCDVFAAGIVLHEVLTGRRLFASQNELETLRRVSTAEAAPPSSVNEAVPPALDAIVMRALSRRRQDRFDSGIEMAAALEALGLAWPRREISTLIAQAFAEQAHAAGSAPIVVDGDTEVSSPGEGEANTSPEGASTPYLSLVSGDPAVTEDQAADAGELAVELEAEPSHSRLAFATATPTTKPEIVVSAPGKKAPLPAQPTTMAQEPEADRDFEQGPTSIFDGPEVPARGPSTPSRTSAEAERAALPAVVLSPSVGDPVEPGAVPLVSDLNSSFEEMAETHMRPMALPSSLDIEAIESPAPASPGPRRATLFLLGGLLGALLVVGAIGVRMVMHRAPTKAPIGRTAPVPLAARTELPAPVPAPARAELAAPVPARTQLAAPVPLRTELAAPAKVEPTLPIPTDVPPRTATSVGTIPDLQLAPHADHRERTERRERTEHAEPAQRAEPSEAKPAERDDHLEAKPARSPNKAAKPKGSVKEGRLVDPFEDG
jgi:serine/threonine-protein kinase